MDPLLVCVNPIPLEMVPIWHHPAVFHYLRHGFRTESEDVVSRLIGFSQLILVSNSSVSSSSLIEDNNARICFWRGIWQPEYSDWLIHLRCLRENA